MAPTAAQVTDPLLWTYTTVLPEGDGVCRWCHGSAKEGYEHCYSCSGAQVNLSHTANLIVPVSLSVGLSQLHHSLKRYKDDSYRQATRDRFSLEIAALFERFLVTHRDCIEGQAGRQWDTITIVPSSKQRPGTHPLETAIRRSPWITDQYRRLLDPGTSPLDHNQMSDTGFAPTEDVSGGAILLLDDTFTTGARAQSAASALLTGGATVIAIVPAARYMNPEWEPSADYLKKAKALTYTFEYCCVGGHPLPPPRTDQKGLF